MRSDKDLVELITKYEEYISEGNALLKEKYSIDVSPLLAKNRGLIPRSGIIDFGKRMIFTFHGMGCLFDFDGVIVDFDYTYNDFVYKGFQPLKLFQFVESYPRTSDSLKNEITFNRTILQLELEGIILRKPKDSIDIYTYQLKKFKI